jgi:acetolactate synthase small subunit
MHETRETFGAGEFEIALTVHRRPFVLARIANLFDRRRIEMWQVRIEPRDDEGLAEIRVRTRGEPSAMERLRRALENVVDVIDASFQEPAAR